jgi:DNA-binding NarL/FixJ family response regulator
LVLGLAVSRNAILAIVRQGPDPTPPSISPKPAGYSFAAYRLSPRESEIAGMLLDGQTNKEIALATGLSYGTVKNHISALYGKLGIGSRHQLHKFRADPPA